MDTDMSEALVGRLAAPLAGSLYIGGEGAWALRREEHAIALVVTTVICLKCFL